MLFRADWITAYNFCLKNGMQLAKAESLKESLALTDFCNRYIDKFDQSYGFAVAFIDGASPSLKSKTDWFNFNTGKKMNFSIPWNKNEPSGKTEHCFSLINTDRRFYANDASCHEWGKLAFQFICEDVRVYSKG